MAANKLVVVTGHKEIDAKLRSMPAAMQRKLVRGALRKSAKREQQDFKRIVRQEAYDTGALQRSTKIRATKRSRVRVGVSLVIDREKLFQEYEKQHGHKPTPRKGESEPHFYPVEIEFGDESQAAVRPLRRSLYDNADAYRAYFVGDMTQFIAEQKVITKLNKATGFGKLK